MKNATIQIVAFFFVALTPYISVAAFPFYVIGNLLFSAASIISLLITARQVGSSLEFPKAGFASQIIQAWYWSNVALAIPCVAVALNLCVFGQQRGDHIVERREALEVNDRSGRVDILLGRSKNDANPNETKLLLAYIMFDPNRSYEKADFSGGDGPDVSATNIGLHAEGESSFSYGSGWNRTNDLIAIQGREFSRKNGNVFLILQTDSYPYDIVQLPETCHATEIDEVIRFAKEQCEKIGETRLRQLRDTR